MLLDLDYVHLPTLHQKRCPAILPTKSKNFWGPVTHTSARRYTSPLIVTMLLDHWTHIFSKAALCALRVVKKVPDISDHFTSKAKNLLTDRNHGVLLTAITLVTEMCQIDTAILNDFRSVSLLIYLPFHNVYKQNYRLFLCLFVI